MKKQYDHIILGGGCAGFQFADALLNRGAENMKLVVLDESFEIPHKSWCMWSKNKHPYDHLVLKKWDKMRFVGPKGDIIHDLGPWSYQYIPGNRFFEWHLDQFREDTRVELIRSRAGKTERTDENFTVHHTEGILQANEVYSSIPEQNIDPDRDIFLWQHFMGWFIETEEDAFDPEVFTLMDFSVSQKSGPAFVYFLPLNSKQALVEFTVFSPDLWPLPKYEAELTQYMEKRLPGLSYTVEKEERGKIPMTTHSFPKLRNDGVINIGSAAGMVKPTTGYAFRRIMEDTAQLVQQGKRRRSAKRFALYDRLLLRIMMEHPEEIADIMTRLFRTQPAGRVFRFLDEQTNLLEEILIFSRLPKMRFLKTLFSEYFTSPQHETLREDLSIVS